MVGHGEGSHFPLRASVKPVENSNQSHADEGAAGRHHFSVSSLAGLPGTLRQDH